MKQSLKHKLFKLYSGLIRRIPVNRRIKNVFIIRSLKLRDQNFDFDFRCPRIDVTWSAAGFPDLLTRHMLFEGMYQEDVLAAIRHFVKTGDVVFDVGGHHGLMAVIAAKATGNTGKVVTFEPNPEARAHIEKHLALNELNHVVVEKVALSSREEESVFYVQSGEVSWNSTIVKEFANPSDESIVVSTTTLDNYVIRTNLIPRVIKIDTEGSEFMILTGARETIKKHKPVLIVEFNPVSAQAAGTTLREFETFLKKEGYDLVVLKRNFLGYYDFARHETYDESRHSVLSLVNVICIPRAS
jgi:FkbM family methyltransferase